MPKTVAIAEVPTVTRTSGPGKYDEVCKFVTELVTDVKRRDSEGILFTGEDGVHLADHPDGSVKSNVGQVCQVLRLTAKQVGAKIALVIKDGEGLYCKYNGEFVAMTDEQKAARQAARENNASAKAIAASQEAKNAAKAAK